MNKCLYCHKEITDKKHPNKKHCSRECQRKREFDNAKKKCPVCGKYFIPNDRKIKTCSMTCRIKSKDRIVECKKCGKVFRVSAKNKRNYCSKECLYERPRISNPEKKKIFTCRWCGKEFETWAYRKSKYCSSLCRSKYAGSIRGKQMYKPDSVKTRGLNWKSQAKLARKRDKYTCQVCGVNGWAAKIKMQVHHIIPYRLWNGDYEKANNLDNLITLCPSCHPRVEAGVVPCPSPKG